MSASGSIYDLGYQRYDGPRLGRLIVALGLLRGTLAASYGIGRGGRAKVIPFVLLGFALLPAVLAVGIAALAAQAGVGGALDEASPISHATYHGLTSTLIMLFCAAQAPELFGKDQRYGVLPLYFSRVLTRPDYALARVGGLFAAVLAISLLPHLVLFLGGILVAPDPMTGLGKEAPDVPRFLAVSVLGSALLAGVAAVIAAWTPRRAYATAAVIAVFIIPPIIVALVAQLSIGDLARTLVLLSPGDIVDGFNAAVYGTLPDNPAVASANLSGLAYAAAAGVGIAGSIALVLRRYLNISG
ncbi:MAG: hypothetical protein WEG56_12345 [Chloroflexota bacterium]